MQFISCKSYKFDILEVYLQYSIFSYIVCACAFVPVTNEPTICDTMPETLHYEKFSLGLKEYNVNACAQHLTNQTSP